MGVTIRTVTPGAFTAEQLRRLGDIVVEAYDAIGALEGDDEYIPELRDVARRASEAIVLAAVDDADGSLVGCVTYAGPDSPWAEKAREGEAIIRMLAVDPAAQGRGVGTLLATACLERARSEGRSAVFLYSLPVMAGAQRIYTRLGFRRVPERDWHVAGLHLMGFELTL